mmetsp:Transcript_6126/g.17273  ORF Transcript_6126/g.17273 Transcript_6126/m.17273 type:complete len:287 (-) Transcript_6126:17-877(-)
MVRGDGRLCRREQLALVVGDADAVRLEGAPEVQPGAVGHRERVPALVGEDREAVPVGAQELELRGARGEVAHCGAAGQRVPGARRQGQGPGPGGPPRRLPRPGAAAGPPRQDLQHEVALGVRDAEGPRAQRALGDNERALAALGHDELGAEVHAALDPLVDARVARRVVDVPLRQRRGGGELGVVGRARLVRGLAQDSGRQVRPRAVPPGAGRAGGHVGAGAVQHVTPARRAISGAPGKPRRGRAHDQRCGGEDDGADAHDDGHHDDGVPARAALMGFRHAPLREQ